MAGVRGLLPGVAGLDVTVTSVAVRTGVAVLCGVPDLGLSSCAAIVGESSSLWMGNLEDRHSPNT